MCVCACVCCVKGLKRSKTESPSQNNISNSVHAWFRSICTLAVIMRWEGLQIEQDSVCVIYASISLLVLFWGWHSLSVWGVLGLCLCSVRFSYPPEFQSGLPSLGPCGVRRGRRPTPSYITWFVPHKMFLFYIEQSFVRRISLKLSTTRFWSKSNERR